MPNSAPVEHVGGTRDDGPWPADVEEITEGESYNRDIVLEDGSTAQVNVTVTRVQQIVRDDGTTTDGYAIVYTADNAPEGA